MSMAPGMIVAAVLAVALGGGLQAAAICALAYPVVHIVYILIKEAPPPAARPRPEPEPADFSLRRFGSSWQDWLVLILIVGGAVAVVHGVVLHELGG